MLTSSFLSLFLDLPVQDSIMAEAIGIVGGAIGILSWSILDRLRAFHGTTDPGRLRMKIY